MNETKQVQEFFQEIRDGREELQSMNEEKNNLKVEIESLELLKSEKEQEIERISNELRDHESRLDYASGELEARSEKLTSVSHQVSLLGEDVKQLQDKFQKLGDIVVKKEEEAKKATEDFIKKVSADRAFHEEAERIFLALEGGRRRELADIKEIMDSYTAKIENQKVVHTEAESELVTTQNSLKIAKEELLYTEEAVSNAKAKQKALGDQNEELELSIEAKIVTLKELDSKSSEAFSRLSKLEEQEAVSAQEGVRLSEWAGALAQREDFIKAKFSLAGITYEEI